MREALRDLRVLWRSYRLGNGFPWPFRYRHIGSRWHAVRFALTGYPFYSPVPLWRQVALIPLRPYRYLRMVRGVARTRNREYAPSDYDAVA